MTKVRFKMYLNDRKVFRLRNVAPNAFLLALPFYVEVGAGLRWQEFGKKWVVPTSNNMQEAHFKRLKNGLWEITCERSLLQKVKEYVFLKYT